MRVWLSQHAVERVADRYGRVRAGTIKCEIANAIRAGWAQPHGRSRNRAAYAVLTKTGMTFIGVFRGDTFVALTALPHPNERSNTDGVHHCAA